jgi:hypothetical protein
MKFFMDPKAIIGLGASSILPKANLNHWSLAASGNTPLGAFSMEPTVWLM